MRGCNVSLQRWPGAPQYTQVLPRLVLPGLTMLTARGFWFFVPMLMLLGLAISAGADSLALIALTLLSWFLAQWFLFHVRWRRAHVGLTVTRALRTPRGDVTSLWAGQWAEVQIMLCAEPGVAVPYVIVSDRLPALARLRDRVPQIDGAIAPAAPLQLSYAIECPAPGRLRFDGVRVQLADLHGFFTATLFVRDAVRIPRPAALDARRRPTRPSSSSTMPCRCSAAIGIRGPAPAANCSTCATTCRATRPS